MPDAALRVGDRVFMEEDRGLTCVGEVAEISTDPTRMKLAVLPQAWSQLNTSTSAAYWHTPLTAEDALGALLPREIQGLAAQRIRTDWRRFEEQVMATWGPWLQELGSAFFDVIDEDIDRSFERHQEELLAIAVEHGEAVSQAWPAIQPRLQPILEEYLTPVLGRLMNEAVSDAPKLRIALSMARGRHAEAYQQILDWFTAYLGEMPEKDRRELREAFRQAWLAASADEVLKTETSRLGREFMNDQRLHAVLSEVYRESVTENPRAAEFFRSRVVESPDFRSHFFALVDLLAPTLREVAALALFDQHGATRPEVVHVLRSVALRREVAWVTLHTPNLTAAPLAANAVIPGRREGGP